LNNGDIKGCAKAILWWNSPVKIIPRQQAEAVQFPAGCLPHIT
jgi:hypothetical protein